MQLYLIRHAIAEDRSADLPDEQRALTPEGRARFREVVRGLERLEIGFDRLYHSPARRTVETAELCTPLLEGESVVAPGLAARPDGALLETLAGECVALVGHEPWLSELAFWLISGWRSFDASGARAPFELKKGGVLRLEGEPRPGAMTLREAFEPRTLRRLGKR